MADEKKLWTLSTEVDTDTKERFDRFAASQNRNMRGQLRQMVIDAIEQAEAEEAAKEAVEEAKENAA